MNHNQACACKNFHDTYNRHLFIFRNLQKELEKYEERVQSLQIEVKKLSKEFTQANKKVEESDRLSKIKVGNF